MTQIIERERCELKGFQWCLFVVAGFGWFAYVAFFFSSFIDGRRFDFFGSFQ